MPFFSPKTWKQRIVEFPGRRRLDDTSSADVYDVSRAEGTVTQEGDGFTAANMNDLEQRINNAVNDVAGLSADEYDPNATYSSGDLRIHDNILHKANQDISVAEPWTPAHWDATTIAAELKAQAEDISDLNSRGFLPNFENVIKLSFSADETWTATEDCWVMGYLIYASSQGGHDTNITCNGKIIASCYNSASNAYSPVCIPLKKGTTIITGVSGGYVMQAYGL